MQFDVVIPTRGNLDTINRLFTSINHQTILPEHIFLVFDKNMSAQEREAFGQASCGIASEEIANRLTPVNNISHDFIPGRGASYTRNYGLRMVKSPYVYFIDDDNILDKDFFEKSIREYQQVDKHGTILYSPTVGWRQTDRIQSVGLRQFHYRLGRAEPMIGGRKAKLFGGICNLFRKTTYDKDFYFPQLIGGNSLFGKTSHFKELQFDERMPFVFEDVDMTHRRYHQIGPIAVSKHNVIHHMEREKTKLEQSFVATEDGVFQKTKNRILFVKNNANSWQRVQFFGVGLWITTMWFALFILLSANHKKKMISALCKGIRAGFNS